MPFVLQTVWEGIVVGFLGGWLALSVVHQFTTRSMQWLPRLDRLQIVPRWTFFAPRPGRTDLHLLVRDVYAGDVCGEWAELPLAPGRGLANALWNPAKRRKKVLLDAVQTLFALIDQLDEADPHPIKITVPYLLLLEVISALPREDHAEHGPVLFRQFQLVESYGHFDPREPMVLFRSEAHRV